jgi:hypothetical protein
MIYFYQSLFGKTKGLKRRHSHKTTKSGSYTNTPCINPSWAAEIWTYGFRAVAVGFLRVRRSARGAGDEGGVHENQ